MRVSIWRVGVAAPVRAGEREQLERLDPAGVGRVRAAAEVGERPVRVERDGLHAVVADEVLDQLDLVGLVLGAEALERRAGVTSSRVNSSRALTCSRIFSSSAGRSCSETVTPSGNSKS